MSVSVTSRSEVGAEKKKIFFFLGLLRPSRHAPRSDSGKKKSDSVPKSPSEQRPRYFTEQSGGLLVESLGVSRNQTAECDFRLEWCAAVSSPMERTSRARRRGRSYSRGPLLPGREHCFTPRVQILINPRRVCPKKIFGQVSPFQIKSNACYYCSQKT